MISHKSYPTYIKNSDSQPVDNIVYIIGESSNPGRYGAYGYHQDTTPNISRMISNNELFILKNIHSPADQTRLAVPMLTSFEKPDELSYLFKYKNLIEMAKLKGYKTYWFDSQNQNGLWDKTFGYISQYADIIESPNKNNSGYSIKTGDDDALLPAVNHYFNDNSHGFYVIHLMGSHLPYSQRRGLNNPFKDNYDASIYHTDETINAIIDMANKKLKNYKLIYVSDHGEVVGHGHGYPTDNNEMYKVPMIVNDPEIVNDINQLRDSNGYFSTDLTKYVVLSMMGFTLDNECKNKFINKSNMVLDEKEDLFDFYKLRNVKLY